MSVSDSIYISTTKSQVEFLNSIIQLLNFDKYSIERLGISNAQNIFATKGLDNLYLTVSNLHPRNKANISTRLGISVEIQVSAYINKFTDISKIREELVYALIQYLELNNDICAYAVADSNVILLNTGKDLILQKDYELWQDFSEININHEFKDLPNI